MSKAGFRECAPQRRKRRRIPRVPRQTRWCSRPRRGQPRSRSPSRVPGWRPALRWPDALTHAQGGVGAYVEVVPSLATGFCPTERGGDQEHSERPADHVVPQVRERPLPEVEHGRIHTEEAVDAVEGLGRRWDEPATRRARGHDATVPRPRGLLNGASASRESGCLARPSADARLGRSTRASSARVQTTASPRRSGSAMALPLVPAVAVDQSRSPALGRPPADREGRDQRARGAFHGHRVRDAR
jgi:hypothetical protein